jgi:1-acyl-sn-glycerol-3-phosphate acyltransferase
MDKLDPFYALVRLIGRFWVWFLFHAVDVRNGAGVPSRGPVLLCINHPNNFIDSLLVGGALERKVHYLATAALFRNSLVGRFLRACGAIPVYRRQDDPDKMDRNLDAFEACFRAFREGRLVAIYPEGTTHAEVRVQRIKTGAARLALGYEAQRPRELSVIPVGLNFDARKSFRGRVLVSFGAPVAVTPYLDAYRADPVKAVEALTDAIQWSMEVRVSDEGNFFIDATVRGGLPSTASLMKAKNFCQIIYHGAHGEMVEPEYGYKFSAECMVKITGADGAWNTVVLEPEIQDALMLADCCEVDEQPWFPADDKAVEEVGWLCATGDTPTEVAKEMNRLADLLPDGADASVEALASIIREISEEEERAAD